MRNEFDANLSMQFTDRRYDKMAYRRKSQWASRAAPQRAFLFGPGPSGPRGHRTSLDGRAFVSTRDPQRPLDPPDELPPVAPPPGPPADELPNAEM